MMETSHNKWRIDTIRSIVFFNKKIEFKKNEWSKLLTGKDQVRTFNPPASEQQYVEMTALDNNQQLNLIHVEDKNIIDLHLVCNKNNMLYDFDEILSKLNEFYELLDKFNPNINTEGVIRIGHVIELSIPVEDEVQGCDILKENFSYLSGFSDGLEEINLRINKPTMNENIKINRVIRFSNAQKVMVNISKGASTPTANIEKNITVNIDVNTDASHKYPFDLINFSNYLKGYLKEIVSAGGNYVNK
ncbi:hypothetical protein HWI77_10600 [Acinetobacter venetianus]|nr:hypothetical protein HWI77_10600 [Acinetobacter venetianus]